MLSENLAAPLPVPAEALRLANEGAPAFTTQSVPVLAAPPALRRASTSLRTIVYPMGRTGPAHRDHRLQISTTLVPLRQTVQDFALLAAGLATIAAALAWFAALGVANRALTPAMELTRAVEAIGMKELGKRVAVPGDLAEFHRMAIAFNGLLDRIERAVRGTRRFTADASHELRAPLTVLRGELELALTRPRSADEYEEVLRRCLDEVVRLSRLADDLLTLARVEGGTTGGTRSAIELDDLVSRAVERKRSLAEARRVDLDLSGSAGAIRGDPDLLLRALDGMVEHAIMASPEEGKVRVRLIAQDGIRSVEVTDSGAGLPPEEISGVFQRFHRSRRARTHSTESGLALAIARAVAERHGGSVDYMGNDPGASFRMTLPAASPESDG